RTCPWLTVVPVIENSDNPWWVSGHTQNPAGMHDLLTGQLGRVVATYGDWTDHDIQVVGSPSMVRATKYQLVAAGVDSDAICHDPLY
ncbi:flavoprotein, partial [Rhodococcus sp. T2V]|nr:flavoprotein [Rhodococcus sp. T2V]